MREKISYYLKKVLNHLHIHQKLDKKDIFIFSTFRSGSTWLAEIIKSQPKIKFPVSPNKIEFLNYIDSYYKKIKPRPYYINLSEEEKKVLKNYIIKASRGEIVYGRRYVDLFSSDHSFISNRSVFRLLRSCYLLDWYHREFDIYTLYLIRHPIAASLSRKRVWKKSSNPSYWSANNHYFLNSNYFKENYLDPDLERYLKAKLTNCSELEDFIITWCLENWPLIKKIQSQDELEFIGLTYEDLLMNSREVISFLGEELELPDQEKMMEQLKIPSSTVRYSDKQTKSNFKNYSYNKEYLLKKWRKQVSSREEKEIFDILEHFGINIYKPDKFMPEEKYLMKNQVYTYSDSLT
ncbi:MAG: hypothetical protein ACOCP5_03770 [Halanaerobiaceae bacterium]